MSVVYNDTHCISNVLTVVCFIGILRMTPSIGLPTMGN